MNDEAIMNGNTIIVGRKLSNQLPKDQASIENDNRSFNLKDRESSSSRRGSSWMKVIFSSIQKKFPIHDQ